MSKNLSRRRALPVIAALAAAAGRPRAFAAAAASQSAPSRPFPPIASGRPLRAAFVYVTPITATGWTAQHEAGRLEMQRALGDRVQSRAVANVPEGPDAERVIRDLARQGNDLIVTTSFGYMEATLKVAREFPHIAFEHCSGYKTAPNLGVYNGRFYQGRYLAGRLAGRMTRTGIAGMVAAFPIPEVIQGINAFTLGMRAVRPDARMKVLWAGTWYDPGRERDAARLLIGQGADVLTHHTNSPAAIQAAEDAHCDAIGYCSNEAQYGPKAQLAAVTLHWGRFYIETARQLLQGDWAPRNVWGGMEQGFVRFGDFNPAVPPGLIRQIAATQAAIEAGRAHPFSGRIVDNRGRVRQSGGVMDDATLLAMNWLVDGVDGGLPRG
jgi:simple sugar transport system substrate-binding protein